MTKFLATYRAGAGQGAKSFRFYSDAREWLRSHAQRLGQVDGFDSTFPARARASSPVDYAFALFSFAFRIQEVPEGEGAAKYTPEEWRAALADLVDAMPAPSTSKLTAPWTAARAMLSATSDGRK